MKTIDEIEVVGGIMEKIMTIQLGLMAIVQDLQKLVEAPEEIQKK